MSDPIDLEEYKASRKSRGPGDWPQSWIDDCQKTDNGKPIPNLASASAGMSFDLALKNVLSYDEMARTICIIDKKSDNNFTEIIRPILDNDVNIIQVYLQLCGLTRVARETVVQAIEMRARERSFHPVRSYLEGLEWDGEARLGGWLNAYLGVEAGPYAAGIGTMFLIAMVARIMRPGCKADYMLILEGPQGAMKSTACATLAGGWFSDNLPDLSKSDPVRLSMHLRGKWLIEIAELASFDMEETHALKEFLTQTQERYLPKFGRNEVHEPRQCLFIGTTNESVYLKDETGGRRFWPVTCGDIDIPALARDRDQLFAEAIHLYQSGTPWWPSREFEAEHIKPEQEKRFDSDAWENLIRHHLIGQHEVTIFDIATGPLEILKSAIHNGTTRRISKILKNLGWKSRHTMSGTIWLK